MAAGLRAHTAAMADSKTPKLDALRKMRERAVDTSDIPEAGEDWFKKAKLTRGMPAGEPKPRPAKKPKRHK